MELRLKTLLKIDDVFCQTDVRTDIARVPQPTSLLACISGQQSTLNAVGQGSAIRIDLPNKADQSGCCACNKAAGQDKLSVAGIPQGCFQVTSYMDHTEGSVVVDSCGMQGGSEVMADIEHVRMFPCGRTHRKRAT